MNDRLEIELHGFKIGELVDHGRMVTLRLYRTYWEMADRPVLGRWFEDGEPDEIYQGVGSSLPAWFDNLIPEGALAKLLARRYDLGDGALELLAIAGHDLPGAVRLIAQEERDRSPLAVVQLEVLEKQKAYSLAGVQLKHSVKLNKDDRLTISSPENLGDWILKIPPPKRWKGLSENEHATMSWARRAGFDVPETRVVPPERVESIVEDQKSSVYLIKRYDRTPEGPVHQEDILQITWLLSDWKYPHEIGDRPATDPATASRRRLLTTHQGLATVVAHLLGQQGVEEYLRRVVFEVATGNGDAHLKNWSFIYPDKKRPQWSPLYDQVSTLALNIDKTLALPLYEARSFNKITQQHLVRLGTDGGLTTKRSIEIVEQTLESLNKSWNAGELYLNDHALRIRAHWKKCPLLKKMPVLAKP